jgi:hypothetical protein
MKPEVSSYVQDLHTSNFCESFAITSPLKPKLVPSSVHSAVTVLVDMKCIQNTGCSAKEKDIDHTTALRFGVHITTDTNRLVSESGF